MVSEGISMFSVFVFSFWCLDKGFDRGYTGFGEGRKFGVIIQSVICVRCAQLKHPRSTIQEVHDHRA